MNSKIIALFISFFIFSLPVEAKNKNEAAQVLSDAENLLERIDLNKTLSNNLPGEIYSRAVINIIKASNYMEASDFDNAYFYATDAIIKLQASEVMAKSRDLKDKKIENELLFYKSRGGTSCEKVTLVMRANLQKKGKVYSVFYHDIEIFENNSVHLKSSGKNKIETLIAILKEFPGSSIKVIVHTANNDYNRFSEFKAEAVNKFIVRKGIAKERVSSSGIGNREVLDPGLGFKRIDRIEIVVSGLDF